MPNLKIALKDQDPGFLRILAEFWGLEGIPEDPDDLLANLIKAMSNQNQLIEIIEVLPSQAKKAIHSLISNNGKIPWVEFCRRHGELREIGQAKLEREKNYLSPISTTEWLWYRGLLFKAFFDEGIEPLEYAYLPEEFLSIPKPRLSQNEPDAHGKAILNKKISHVLLANDQILDQACTLLTALRMGLKLDERCNFTLPVNLLAELLRAAFLIDDLRQPNTEQTRAFLEAKRAQALMQLYVAWAEGKNLNELWLMPELKCEGKWKNNPPFP